MKRNLIEILNELGDYIDDSDTPRETALLLLGFSIGVAVRVGWAFDKLVALNLWPKATPATPATTVVE